MEFTKKTIRKQTSIDGGEAREIIDVRLQLDITEGGESYEDIRFALKQALDKKFSQMFAMELGIMPERLQEGERWRQLGLFDDPVAQVANALNNMGASIGNRRTDD